MKVLTVLFASLAFAQEPPNVASLVNGFYYQTPQGWKRLEPLTMAGGGLKHVGKMFVPGLTPQMVWTFRGAESPVQLQENRPTFLVKEFPALANTAGFSSRDLIIVRFDKKKDHRELQNHQRRKHVHFQIRFGSWPHRGCFRQDAGY